MRKGKQRKQFKCGVCGYRANSPTKLGAHYRKSPTHASDKSIQARKLREEVQSGTMLPLVAAQPRAVKRNRLKFCPDCGHDLRNY